MVHHIPTSGMRDALEHQQQLQSHLSSLISAANNGNSISDLAQQLSTIQIHVNGMSEYLSLTIPPILYNERRQPSSTKASEVLLIPELSEMILVHIGLFNLFNVSATCCGLKAIIDDSPKLQTALFLRPGGEPKGKFTYYCANPLARHFRFSTFAFPANQRFEDRRDVIVELSENGRQDRLRFLGRKFKNMQIYRPPIYRMSCTVRCLSCGHHDVDNLIWSQDEHEIVNSNGLTLGELHDVADKILKTEKCSLTSFCLPLDLAVKFRAYGPWEEAEEERERYES